jgi:hypothetical protein
MKTEHDNRPDGFFFEQTIKRRYFVPLLPEIVRAIADKEWEYDQASDKEDPPDEGIPVTEDQSRADTEKWIGERLRYAIENGEIFSDMTPELEAVIEKSKTLVCEDGDFWGEMGIVAKGENPKDSKPIIC